MSGELLGLVMLVVMIGVIFIGFPVAFTLLFLALTIGWIGLGGVVFDLAFFQTIGMMKEEETLAAVPLFIFMGFVVEQAGLTVLGIMAAPIMMRSGYNARMAAGAIAAGGTLGILVPPSVMLIVMGPVMGVSVANLYAAAFGPGFMLASLYILYCLIRSFIDPRLGPPVPRGERATSAGEIVREVVVGVLPLGLLISATLGSILGGLATPTEAASVGASAAMILALAYRKLSPAGLKQAAISTITTSSMVLFLAVASNVFGAASPGWARPRSSPMPSSGCPCRPSRCC